MQLAIYRTIKVLLLLAIAKVTIFKSPLKPLRCVLVNCFFFEALHFNSVKVGLEVYAIDSINLLFISIVVKDSFHSHCVRTELIFTNTSEGIKMNDTET